MGPVIVALGRSENHPILKFAATSLGVEYLEIETGLIELALETVIQDLQLKIRDRKSQEPAILTVIDASVGRSRLQNFIGKSQEVFSLPLSLLSDLRVFATIEKKEFPNFLGADDPYLFAISAARSEHGQVALWPVIKIDREGRALPITFDQERKEILSSALSLVMAEISELKFVGVMSWFLSPEGEVLEREWGLAATTIWSESACITGVGEQFIRALVNLPLGDTQLINYEDFYLESEIDLTTGPFAPYLATSDPTRPFLHLFARNPRLKVKYLDSKNLRAKISVWDSDPERALQELSHGERFMLGYDDE